MAQNFGIIYKATSPSGKVYVGKTAYSLSKRIGEHVSERQRNGQ
jgi:hypothetical protein